VTGRARIYEAEEMARNMRRTFTDKPVTGRKELPFTWPRLMRHVGSNEGVAYSSDKWKKDGEYELYKHIAESKNRVLVLDGFLRDFDDPSKPWPAIGPYVDLTDVPLPKHFAFLAYLEEVNLRLHTHGTDAAPKLGDGDDGYVKVALKHGLVGGATIRWDLMDPRAKPQTVLFVYTEADGPLMLIEGEKLDVEKDGIVG
jgi:hypothetical protein